MVNKKDYNLIVQQLLPFLLSDRHYWINYEKDNKDIRSSDLILLLICHYFSTDNIIDTKYIYAYSDNIDKDYLSRVMRKLVYAGYLVRITNVKYLITQKGIDFCLDYIDKIKLSLSSIV